MSRNLPIRVTISLVFRYIVWQFITLIINYKEIVRTIKQLVQKKKKPKQKQKIETIHKKTLLLQHINMHRYFNYASLLKSADEKKKQPYNISLAFFVHVFTLNRDLMLIDFIKLAIQAPLEKSTILHLNTVKPFYFLST